ncbi:MAG: four helix bundle protein [Bacteroidales bacterium]|nr:four helix bundle protein [Bacteroidales bacterium]
MHNFKELNVWKKAIELSTHIYKITGTFPNKEQFGLISQINRSCVSIPANIAEGAGRETKKDFSYFLSVSLGSSFELETLLLIALNIGYINIKTFDNLNIQINQLQRMLYSLKKSLIK